MSKIERIKAEIERLKNELIQEVEKGCKSEFDEGRISAFEDMITFIDSLEEDPVSEDLEKALVREWHGYNDRGAATVDALEDNTQELAFAKGFYRGAQWQKERDQSTIELAEDHAYLAGQEKVIDKACEWLADNYSNYIVTNGLATMFKATIDFDTIRMIEDFKKAMEE